MTSRWRCGAVAVLMMAVCMGAPPPGLAQDGAEETAEAWNWDKFIDYGLCAVSVAGAFGSGGIATAFAVLACGKALVLHFDD